MSGTRDRNFLAAYMLTLAAAVAGDGAVGYTVSALTFVSFSVMLFFSAGEMFHRLALHRLRGGSLLLSMAIAAHCLATNIWDDTGSIAHPVWQHLVEQFGASGGTRAISRLQAIWELPGALLPMVSFAVAVTVFRHARNVERIWIFLSFLGAVFALYGLMQEALFPHWHFGERTAYTDSLTSFYVNRNVAAAFLLLTSLATLVVLDRDINDVNLIHWKRLLMARSIWRPIDRRIAVFASLFFLQFVAMFLTKSRAGSVVGLFAIFGFIGLQWREYFAGIRQNASRRALVAAAVICGAFIVLIAGRVSQRYDVQGLEDSRWCVYPAMLKMAFDNLPWGVGLGGFAPAFASYRDATCGIAGIWDSAHDLYIQGVVTMGVLFPIALAAASWIVIPALLEARDGDGPAKAHATATLIAVSALAVHSIVDFPLEIPANTIVLATMIASSIGLATDRRRAGRRRRRVRRAAVNSS